MGLALIVFGGIGLFIVLVFVFRLLGAWMLRIDEVIKHQKETIAELKKLTEHINKS